MVLQRLALVKFLPNGKGVIVHLVVLRYVIKILISLCVILTCALISRKLPSLAGLIAVMPLTGLLVLLWVYSENHGNTKVMVDYCTGALWGILPSIGFFLVAFLCFRKQLSLPIVLSASFAVWIAGAIVHQWLLGK